MNKNFEEAYKEEVQQNIPDLWSRIESSLPEKKVIPEVPVAAVQSEPIQGANSKQTNLNHKSNKEKRKSPYAWMKWASVAAAAVLVVIILPSVAGTIFWWSFAFGNATSDSAAAEQMAMDTVVMDEDIKMESAEMDATLEDTEQNVMQGSVSAEETTMGESDRKVLARGVLARPVIIMSSYDSNYCTIQLEIPRELYSTFEGREEFETEWLEVRFYYDDESEIPKTDEYYSFKIIEVGTEKYLVAELEP